MKLLIRAVSMSGALLAGAAAQGAVITFDTASQITNEFNRVGTAGAALFSTDPTLSGLGGTLGVTPNVSVNGSVGRYYTQTAFDSQADLSVGIYLQIVAPTVNGAAYAAVVGFAGEPTNNAAVNEGLNYTTARTGTNGGFLYGFRASLQQTNTTATTSGAIYQIRLANVVDAPTGGSFTTLAGGLSLTTNNWYYFSLNIDHLSTTNYSLVTSLYNSDSNGVLGASVFTGTNALGNSYFGLDADGVYGYFGAQTPASRSGVGVYDNFTIDGALIPEPATVALLAIGLGAVAASRRRVKRD